MSSIDRVPTIYQGATSPEYFELGVSRIQNVDLATQTQVKLELKKPSGAFLSLTMEVTASSSDELSLKYSFPVGATQMDEVGAWLAYLDVYVPGGKVRTDTFVLPVLDRFGVPTPNN